MSRKPARAGAPRRTTRLRPGRPEIPPFERFTDDTAMVAALILLRRAGMTQGRALDEIARRYGTSAKDVDRAAHTERDTVRTYMKILSEYGSDDLERIVAEQRVVAESEASPRWRRKRPRD